MRRITLSTAVGVVGLMAVSLGLCQTAPPALPPPPAAPPPLGAVPVPPVFTAEPTFTPPPPRGYLPFTAPPAFAPPQAPVTAALPPALPPSALPPSSLPPGPRPQPQPPVFTGDPTLLPPPPRGFEPVTTPEIAYPHAEKMTTLVYTVKVYSVPDLVADIQRRPATGIFAFGVNPEAAVAMQQVQLQIQMAQKMAGQPVAAETPEGLDEVTRKLERLKKALRVAARKKSWAEDGGEGEIEVYPEALCLIVRQTASGHEAIEDLLTQLRATQNIQIELNVEFISFDGVPEDAAATAMKMMNRELSAEELVQFRSLGGKTAMSSVVKLGNGRSVSAAITPGMPLEFTALTSADHSHVEFRTDLAISMAHEDAAEMAAMLQTLAQTRTVAVGKSIAFMMSADGDAVLLVTPKVIDRSKASAK